MARLRLTILEDGDRAVVSRFLAMSQCLHISHVSLALAFPYLKAAEAPSDVPSWGCRRVEPPFQRFETGSEAGELGRHTLSHSFGWRNQLVGDTI